MYFSGNFDENTPADNRIERARKRYAAMSAVEKQDRICKQKIAREINRKTKEEACKDRLQNPCSQNHEASVSKYPNIRSATSGYCIYIYTCITLSLFIFWVKTF